jgi:ABC-2 type transport system permease protein
MFHLLQLEWKKQKSYILFKVLIASYVLLLPAVLMIGKKIKMEEGMPFDPQKVFFEFPTVWDWLGYAGNWLIFFILGFMAVLSITNEHASRTLRQNIITGLHRGEFFRSKLWFIVFISAAATVYYALCALVIGSLHTDIIYLSTVFKEWDIIPRYFLMSAGYMSFGLLVGVLVKRTGIALFVFLGYSMFLEPVLRWAVHFRFLKNKSMHFYPLNSFEDLCPVPFAKLTEGFLKENNFNLFLSPTEAAVTSVVFISLFLWISFLRLKNSDL